jgi:hypothetical protein
VHSRSGDGRECVVRTQKETDRARCTHILEMAEGKTCQDTERNRPREVHSPPGGWQREGPVSTQNETDQVRHTYFLETAEGGTCHGTERNRLREAHSRPVDDRGSDLSEHEKKQTERGTLTN